VATGLEAESDNEKRPLNPFGRPGHNVTGWSQRCATPAHQTKQNDISRNTKFNADGTDPLTAPYIRQRMLRETKRFKPTQPFHAAGPAMTSGACGTRRTRDDLARLCSIIYAWAVSRGWVATAWPWEIRRVHVGSE
jgi:hypothetical protein